MNTLLYCGCNNLASPICTQLSCINCCLCDRCPKHSIVKKNKMVNKIKNKNIKKNKKNRNKVMKELDYKFENNLINESYKSEEYSNDMLDSIKYILNTGINCLIPELTNYIVDSFIDNRNSCAVCNTKRDSDILYPCYYCNKLVCDDNCNECKNSKESRFDIIYYCLTCKDNGIISDNESENLDNYNIQHINYESESASDELDDISIISADSTITEYSIDFDEIIKKNKNCDCGKKAKYLIKTIGKISRCWKCSNLLSPKETNPKSHYKYVCDLNCHSGIYIDSLEKINNKYIIESFVDKDECYKCGVRNMNTYMSEVIKFIDEPDLDPRPKCDCGNVITYKLKNKSEIKCIGCEYILYNKNELDLNICSTKCGFERGWKIMEYIYGRKRKVNIEFKFLNKDYECVKCCLKQDLETIFIGDKITFDEKLYFL